MDDVKRTPDPHSFDATQGARDRDEFERWRDGFEPERNHAVDPLLLVWAMLKVSRA